MMETITVGSVNIDLMAYASRKPRAGETLLGTRFAMLPGGKGLHQAVQVARSGCASHLVARIGDDAFARIVLDYLRESGVGLEFVVKDPVGTGIGHVLVEPDDQYSAVIVARANSRLSPADVDRASSHFVNGSGLLLQREIPLETNTYAAAKAKKGGGLVFLNAAPAGELPKCLLRNIDVLIVNEIEAEMLCGVAVNDISTDGVRALKALGRMCRSSVISVGARGCLLTDFVGDRWHVPAYSVAVRRTLGAGDAFVGELAVRVMRGNNLLRAAQCANSVAAQWVSGAKEVGVPTEGSGRKAVFPSQDPVPVLL